MKRLIYAAFFVLLMATLTFGQGSGYNSFQTTTFIAPNTGVNIFQNSLIKYHQLIWTVSGTVSTCQVSLDTSPDGSTWTVGGVITAQLCTTTGSSAITGVVSANYLRVNLSTFSGGGSVMVVYEGWAYNPAGGGGGTCSNTLTFNASGAGGAPGTGFNCSTGYTASYNSIGAFPITGGTFTGKIITLTPVVGGAGFNLPHGVAPTAPVNGDCWTTTGGLFCQINGATQGPFGTGTGAVLSVSNADGTLTVSPTTGSVVGSLALGHPNTWTSTQTFPSPVFTGTPDASGASQFKLPVAGAFVSAANGEQGYDSTNLNWHIWANGLDNIKVIFPASTTITNGDCVQWSKVSNVITVGDAGVGCNTSVNISGQVVGQLPLPGTAFSITNTLAAGTNQGFYNVVRPNTTQGTAAALAETQVGDCTSPTTVTGAGTTATVAYTDVVGCNVEHDIAGSAGATITIPTPTTLNNAHPIFVYTNNSANTDTLSPTTFTISSGNVAAASSLSVPAATSCKVQLDPVNASTWKADCHKITLAGTITIASGTSAMGTGAITFGTCATVVTTTATGVATTDAIIVSPNTDPTAVTGYGPSASGSLYIQAYPTSGNVNFKVCNNTSGSITPSALTLNWRVVR